MIKLLPDRYRKVGCLTEEGSEYCACNENLCNGGTKREAEGAAYLALVAVLNLPVTLPVISYT